MFKVFFLQFNLIQLELGVHYFSLGFGTVVSAQSFTAGLLGSEITLDYDGGLFLFPREDVVDVTVIKPLNELEFSLEVLQALHAESPIFQVLPLLILERLIFNCFTFTCRAGSLIIKR